MPPTRVTFLTSLAMIAFACNSLLCRLALNETSIDAASFTSIRLISGACVLCLIVTSTRANQSSQGSWVSALALFAYAAGFSFAYISLPASTGALLLFGAVQATMIAVGIWSGERLDGRQLVGFVLAIVGLIALLLPGLTAPPLGGSMLMVGAGIAWGVYSLRGQGGGAPILTTAGNFVRAVPLALLLSLVMRAELSLDTSGIYYAVAAGAITSGLGYVIWYSVLPALRATNAATVQLSVPVITAIGGIVLLGESVTLRLLLASLAILGGIALVIQDKEKSRSN